MHVSWNESRIDCLKLSWNNKFSKGSLPWIFNTINLKSVSHGECKGLEMSQFEQFCARYKHRVLKGVNLMIIHRGLENESISDDLLYRRLWRSWKESTFAVCVRVLKWVSMHQFPIFLWGVLNGVQCIVLKAGFPLFCTHKIPGIILLFFNVACTYNWVSVYTI